MPVVQRSGYVLPQLGLAVAVTKGQWTLEFVKCCSRKRGEAILFAVKVEWTITRPSHKLCTACAFDDLNVAWPAIVGDSVVVMPTGFRVSPFIAKHACVVVLPIHAAASLNFAYSYLARLDQGQKHGARCRHGKEMHLQCRCNDFARHDTWLHDADKERHA